jgi:hypothetical protein
MGVAGLDSLEADLVHSVECADACGQRGRPFASTNTLKQFTRRVDSLHGRETVATEKTHRDRFALVTSVYPSHVHGGWLVDPISRNIPSYPAQA